MIDLSNRVAVVTGAGSGIGRATAVALARCGAAVALTDINETRVSETVDLVNKDGGTAIAVLADAGESADWRFLAEAVRAELGRPAILVNNAFYIQVMRAVDLPEESWNRQLAVSLTSVYLSVRTFAADLAAEHGSIVNIASVHARLGLVGHPAYAAAKGAIVSLTQQLAVELGPDVRVNTVLPGPILTRGWDSLPSEDRERAARGTALQRLGRPEEVAAAVCFLASEAASFVTAASLLVDGGYVVRKDLADA